MRPDISPVSPSCIDSLSPQLPVWSRLRLPDGQRAGEVAQLEDELEQYCRTHFKQSWSSLRQAAAQRQVERLAGIERRVHAFEALLKAGQAPHTLKRVFKQILSTLEEMVGDGCLAAQLLLGQVHLRIGYYFHPEIAECFGLSALQAAINEGCTHGYSVLGDYYLSEGHSEAAVEAYTEGAAHHCARCCYQLAQLHTHGVNLLERNPVIVFSLFERAYTQGFSLAAVGMVRVWLESSEPLPLPACPIEMMREAIEKGCVGAKLVLADLHAGAAGRMQSLREAVSLYRCAAIEGDVDAQMVLAEILQNPALRGLPVEPDIDEAIEWYKKAIETGAGLARILKDAHAELGRLYMWRKRYCGAAAVFERAISLGATDLIPLLDACKRLAEEA